MKFDHKAENTALMPEAWYEGKITKAEETTSKQGNNMLVLHVKVGGVFIKDYIVASVSFHISKLKRLCTAVGVDYTTDEVTPEQLEGHDVAVFVKVDEGTGKFGDKNIIGEYAQAGEAAGKEVDDDIPF